MKVIPVLFFLLMFQPLFAQYNWEKLQQELEANQQILGENLVCMVANKDSLLFKKEMGGFNSQTQAPIASCSKWLTAALVMQFVDEGKLSLDDKVVKYIPEFEKYFKSYITIRQCLCHMTGIESPEGGLLKSLLERRKFSSLEEEVNNLAARKIRSNPGTDFWYSGIGLNIAGRVIEVISKKKFEVIIKQKLFAPLEMTKTTFADPNGQAVNPSGGARSTADDYMKFLSMLLNNGVYKGQQILSANSIALMREVQDKPEQVLSAPKAADGFLYALGSWAVEQKTDTVVIMHEGRSVPNPARIPVTTATALASPGLFGTWPMVDFCRGYTYIVFVKNLLGEQRAEVHRNLKKVIDKQIANTCR